MVVWRLVKEMTYLMLKQLSSGWLYFDFLDELNVSNWFVVGASLV